MNLRFSFAFLLVCAVVCHAPLFTVSMSTKSQFRHEQTVTKILNSPATTAYPGLRLPRGISNNNNRAEQQQHVSPAQPHDLKETSRSSSVLSDIDLYPEKLTQNHSERVIRQRDSSVFTTPKPMCPATDSENVTQNTTEFSNNKATSVSLVNSTLDCRHIGRSTQTTTRTIPRGFNGEGEPTKDTKTSSQNSVGVWNSSCSAEPIQRLCGCTSVCIQLNNCCYDSEYVNFDQESISYDTQYSCYENFGKKWILHSPSRLIDKCLPEWTDDSVRQRCEAPNPSDFESYLPCHSPETDLVYTNAYCLRCNFLVNISAWEMTFQSSYSLGFSQINTFQKMNTIAGIVRFNRGHYFSVSPPANQEPLHCLPSLVRKCNDEFNNNATLSKLCRAYYDPVLMDGVPYRNIDCVRCSSNHSGQNIVRFSKRGTDVKFKVLLKLAGQVQKCLGETCSPTVSRIRGYTERYPLSVTTINRDGAAVNASTTNDILHFWKVALMNKTRSELAGFNIVISFPTHINNYTMSVTIYDEIRIDQVPQIQKAVRSVSLHVNYSDTISVSCHVIQLGSESTPPSGDVKNTNSENSFMSCINNAEGSFATVAVFLACLMVNWVLFNDYNRPTDI